MAISETSGQSALPSQSAHAVDDSFDGSLWQETATARVNYEALRGAQRTEVAVVGAGYAGLCAALALAEQGVAVTVVDAVEPGSGASGRNGGQVIPLCKLNPDELQARYGDDVGRGIHDLVSASSDAVFGTIARLAIDCEAARGGWIQAAHSTEAARSLERRFLQLKQRGENVDWLTTDAIESALGTRSYVAGWLHRDAGTIQPLSYARGLARAASARGAVIHGHTLVRRLERTKSEWRLWGDHGTLTARQVILAGNAYTTDLWPRLVQSFVPVYSMQIATGPLPRTTAQTILPGVSCASDTRRLLTYFRKDAAGRFVIGSRGPFTSRPEASDATGLLAAARRTFPQLTDIPFPYRWAGRVAITTDHLPHLHNPAPGLWAVLGCNGRGVGLASILGFLLASACRLKTGETLQYPVSDVKSIPFHAFHRVGVNALVAYFRMLDAFDRRAGDK